MFGEWTILQRAKLSLCWMDLYRIFFTFSWQNEGDNLLSSKPGRLTGGAGKVNSGQITVLRLSRFHSSRILPVTLTLSPVASLKSWDAQPIEGQRCEVTDTKFLLGLEELLIKLSVLSVLRYHSTFLSRWTTQKHTTILRLMKTHVTYS